MTVETSRMQNRLALGTAQFGMDYGIANKTGKIAPNECSLILAKASAAGVNTIDTASLYGSSETVLGNIGTRGFRVVTKLPGLPGVQTDISRWVREQLAASLSRLQQARVYALLLHRPLDLLSPNGATLFRALLDLKAEGLAVKVGYSIYSPAELETLSSQFPADIVQIPGSVFDRRFRNSGWLTRLAGAGVEVHMRSAFLQGLLLTPPETLQERFSPWQPLLSAWHVWCKENGLSPFEACLAYALNDSAIDRVVVGVDSASQLSEILSVAANNRLRNLELPARFQTSDENLVNPATWGV